MKGLFLTAALGVVCVSAFAQGTFRNMDFGLSQIPSSTPSGTLVPVSQAFPFWTAYFGGLQVTNIFYNGVALGSVNVSLLPPPPADLSQGGIPGHNTAVIQAGDYTTGLLSAALAQTAQIPAGAMSLLFVATPPNGAGWQVSIGGQAIPVVEVSQVDSRFNEYGANISAFAGQVDELRFTALAGSGLSQADNLYLGEIQFSPVAVPEPSPLALAGLGFAAMLMRCRKMVLMIVLAVGCVSAFGQGTLNFANAGLGWSAAVVDSNGIGLSGSGWNVDLYWAPGVVVNSSVLTPLNQPATFSTVPSQAGFFFGGTRRVPTAPGVITAQVRVWDAASGSSWLQAAETPDAMVGASTLFQVTIADANANLSTRRHK